MGCMNRGCSEKSALMTQITQISFVMDELRLYLDTHPDHADALAMFTRNRSLRQQLIDRYTERFGAPEAYSAGGSGEWDWTQAPMPWESEAN